MKTNWSIKMKNAHSMARRISDFNYNSYQENLSIVLKVQHMLLRQITLADINWLMNYFDNRFVILNLEHLNKDALFTITGGINYIEVEHYIRPRTEAEDNKAIGVMIESELKTGHKRNLD